MKIIHFSLAHDVYRNETAGKTGHRLLVFSYVLNNGHSQFVHINVRPQIVEHSDEYDPLSASLKNEENAVSPQTGYLILYFSVNSTILLNRGCLLLFI